MIASQGLNESIDAKIVQNNANIYMQKYRHVLHPLTMAPEGVNLAAIIIGGGIQTQVVQLGYNGLGAPGSGIGRWIGVGPGGPVVGHLGGCVPDLTGAVPTAGIPNRHPVEGAAWRGEGARLCNPLVSVRPTGVGHDGLEAAPAQVAPTGSIQEHDKLQLQYS